MNKTVMFLHIPKTAGTTITSFFREQYSADEVYLSGSSGRTHWEGSAEFANKSLDERQQYKYVAGHLEMNAFRGVKNKFAFTFMRSPVKRMMSLYNYVRRTQSHHMHTLVNDGRLGFGDFVARAPWDELRNGMTRRLCGVHKALPEYDERVLCTAIGNLDAMFDFVGIQESFDKSLFLLGQQLGVDFNQYLYTSKNVAPKAKKSIDPADIRMIKRHNCMDEALYEHAKKRFIKMASPLKKGPGKQEFKQFKRILKQSENERMKAAA